MLHKTMSELGAGKPRPTSGVHLLVHLTRNPIDARLLTPCRPISSRRHKWAKSWQFSAGRLHLRTHNKTDVADPDSYTSLRAAALPRARTAQEYADYVLSSHQKLQVLSQRACRLGMGGSYAPRLYEPAATWMSDSSMNTRLVQSPGLAS